MADNTIEIAVQKDFQETIARNFEKYIPVLSDNISIIRNLLTDTQYKQVKQYEAHKDDAKNIEKISKLLEQTNKPAIEKAKSSKYWTEYKKIVGKDFNKFMPLLSDNYRVVSGYLTEVQRQKIDDYDNKEIQRNQQARMIKLLEEANQTKLDIGLKSKFQKGKPLGEGMELRSSAFDAKDFKKYIPIFAENMRAVSDVLTDNQKLQIEYYQQQKDMKEKQDEIAKILREANKPKYQKIKDKLVEKYNQAILKNRFFEKTMDALKDLKRGAGHWIWELIKTFAVLSIFDPGGQLFKMFTSKVGRVMEKVVKMFLEMLPDIMGKVIDITIDLLAKTPLGKFLGLTNTKELKAAEEYTNKTKGIAKDTGKEGFFSKLPTAERARENELLSQYVQEVKNKNILQQRSIENQLQMRYGYTQKKLDEYLKLREEKNNSPEEIKKAVKEGVKEGIKEGGVVKDLKVERKHSFNFSQSSTFLKA